MSQDLQPTNPEPSPLGGRYKIISELGAGGFGQTFLAEDLHLPGRPRCVVKQLKPQTKDPKGLVMARRLFDTEAQALYKLGIHNQIPRLLAHFEDNQEFYLAQELVEGEPLTQELVVGQPWSETQVVALLQDILQVLAFVHQQQVIHRDLKPANLIRRKWDGRIVLIDFGAVKQVSTQIVEPDDGQTNLTISIGTKGYMPNEQIAGNPRFSSDVYAVGRLGIQALTGLHPKRLGEDPVTGELNWRQVSGDSEGDSHTVQVSPELADILDCMVRYDFRDRYPTAVEALEALRSLPSAILDLIPPPQPIPNITEAPTYLESSSGTKKQTDSEVDRYPTESEVELTPTDIWVPTQAPEMTSATKESLDETTAPLSSQDHQINSSDSKAIAKPEPEEKPRWWRKPGSIVAIVVALAAVGTSVFMGKTMLSSLSTNQIVERGTSTASPNPSPGSSSVQSPIPPTSPQKPQPAELLKEAERLRQTGESQKALELYDKIIALKPNMAEAYWGRCYSLNNLKKPNEAIVACNDALDLKPNYAEALWSKGNALDQQKLPLDALQLYERATKIKPNFTEAWVDYGIALQGFGRSEEAIRALDKAIALRRNSAEAWSTKGEALWNLGRFDRAIAALDKALEIEPNYPEARKLREKARKELGR
ncbi:MAG: tetratricopeptide repeat protein [Microcoleus sp. SIO2G3]|nr:tetratricopeptide repeat protein [Microcoleus sp. SIO2G3]